MEEMRGGEIGGDIISEERLRAVEKLTEQLQKIGGRSEIRRKQEGAVLNKMMLLQKYYLIITDSKCKKLKWMFKVCSNYFWVCFNVLTHSQSVF